MPSGLGIAGVACCGGQGGKTPGVGGGGHINLSFRSTSPALQLVCGVSATKPSDFLHEARPTLSTRNTTGARMLFFLNLFCFALELFDVNYQDLVKSGENRAMDWTVT